MSLKPEILFSVEVLVRISFQKTGNAGMHVGIAAVGYRYLMFAAGRKETKSSLSLSFCII